MKLNISSVCPCPSLQGLGTSWHQDNAYFGLSDGSCGTAMWTAVHDADLTNGTLHLLAGRQDTLLPHSRDLASDHHITCSPSLEGLEGEPAIVPAGGVVFFNCNVPHCTKVFRQYPANDPTLQANLSPHPRAAVAYHFVSSSVAPARRQFSLPDGADYTAVPVVAGSGLELARQQQERRVWRKMTE